VRIDQDERDEIIRRLLAVMTGRLEDVPALAVEGRPPTVSAETSIELAKRISERVTEVAAMSDAVVTICAQLLDLEHSLTSRR